MTNRELELWNKISAFKLDKPGVRLTFAKRLAKENGISEQFAGRIVDEYRKFIFLCCVSKGQISPSHLVDEAWHLHLTYTRSYWGDLCKNTIGRDLHHEPTEGGKQEDEKFKGLYADTLALYERYFGSKAPEDIWPIGNEVPQKVDVKIDHSQKWIIPQTAALFHKQKSSLLIVAIIFVTLLLGCTSGAIPLVVVVIVLVIGGAVFLIRRNNNRSGSGGDSGCGSGCSTGGSCSNSHHGDSSSDGSDGGGGDSGCSSGGCSGGCGGGGD